MIEFDLTYYLISATFIVALNLVVFASLRASYSSNKKTYLALSSWALAVEALRQLPEYYLGLYPDSNILYFFSALVQFAASLIFLCALNLVKGQLTRRIKIQISSYIGFFALCSSAQLINGLPTNIAMWYVFGAPAILISAAIARETIAVAPSDSASRGLLILSSMSLLLVRIWIPAIESIALIDLIYYIDVLLFPIMLMALNLDYVEKTKKMVSKLLTEKTQSEEDLQFILDNSIDIILTANNVGLLISWNKRAEGMFGYSRFQAIGKVHIDELFYDNYWHQNANEFSDFDSTMENIDGVNFPVNVRMKTVRKEGKTYSVYVIHQAATDTPNQNTPANFMVNAMKKATLD
jgi:PAS domain S-box-containing protein